MDNPSLASHVKQALKGSEKCTIEIHSPMGNPAGERLKKTLSAAGVKTKLIEIVANPNTGILIECSQECSKLALAVQTAFGIIGMEAHLLVQNTREPNMIVIHLNGEGDFNTPKKG